MRLTGCGLIIPIVSWPVRTAYRYLAVSDVNDLNADKVFTFTATAPCRLLNRIFGVITTPLQN